MALNEMSANILESEAMSRKRSHEEFAGEAVKVESTEAVKPSALGTKQPTLDSFLPRIAKVDDQPSPQALPGLTEGGSSTPARKSSSPQTPTKSTTEQSAASLLKPNVIATSSIPTSTTNPPAKKPRLTPAEKLARDKELAEQKKEREEARATERAVKAVERAEKAAEKAKAEEEKAARIKEKAAEKAKAEEEKAARLKEKAAEKAKAEEEKAAKAKERDDKKRKKEEEQKKIQEEKDKKARSQPTLGSFFKLPSTPKKLSSTSQGDSKKDASPSKLACETPKSEYEKLFQPFFRKANTEVAKLSPDMTEETRNAKSKILDECINGQRCEQASRASFDAIALFALPGKPRRRGMLHHPVRHIMEQVNKESEMSGHAEPDHAHKIMKEARQKLEKIPMKVIAFSQDVRPPYYGTVTFQPFALGRGNMSQLARKPTDRRLPLDYEYDSEAEWQEEEGEDLDMDDDEEELDDEDDMEEFLDDSEDAGLSRRVFANALEPDSTGLCFEGGERVVLNQTVFDHRMEFMHDGLEQSWGIDPFSTEYWEPEPKTKTIKTVKATKSSDNGTKMPPPSVRVNNAFAALGSGGAPAADAPKLVKDELMDDVKKAILDNSSLSKVGIEDVIFQQFRDKASRTEVKNTLVHVAERQGKGRQKAWVLKPGHSIASS
ncbi:chromatin assembly factor 1 subunit A-domain-containing protein [Dactylonectria macrodidyma]|uniref:Chromatin assembly factor 1 subunit A-domain-containing protein n=1 Tax=Dactylonectria macrodidyma TaxID=307937 RepID=A0A9P9JFD1_9HYPO|nr:chromatin assembly factor 1 subunit A-domain-containing protein [Dactylonectria macrodidyma]